MNQTKKESLIETVTNTFSAFILSMLIHRFFIAPRLVEYAAAGNNPADWTAAFSITVVYTILSLARNYIIRRFFEKRRKK